MADKFVVTAISVRLTIGVLVLSKEQAAVRSHNLKELGKGRWEVVKPVEFKRGEIFGYEGDIPKVLGDNLTAKDEAEKLAKAKAKADVAAQAEADKETAKEREKAEAEAAKVREKIEAEAKTQWDASEQLRTEHANDFAAFLASVLEQQG